MYGHTVRKEQDLNMRAGLSAFLANLSIVGGWENLKSGMMAEQVDQPANISAGQGRFVKPQYNCEDS